MAKNPNYTAAELELICAEYPVRFGDGRLIRELADRLGRTVFALRLKAAQMRLGRPISERQSALRGLSAEERIWGMVDKSDDGCWLWRGCVDGGGYGQIVYPARPHRVRVHRLLWSWTYGPIPDGLLLCHRCDVRRCVNPAHLFLGTHQDNTNDCCKKGRQGSKLTAARVAELRARASSGERVCRLAREFGISNGHALNIVHGKFWKVDQHENSHASAV